MKICLIFFLLLLQFYSKSQTSILVVITSGEAYIGADSKVNAKLYSKENGMIIVKDSIFYACKIKYSNGYLLSASGLRGEDILNIGKKVATNLNSWEMFVKGFNSEVIEYLNNLYSINREKSSLVLAEFLDKKKYFSEVVVCKFINNEPRVLRLFIYANKKNSGEFYFTTISRFPTLNNITDVMTFELGYKDCMEPWKGNLSNSIVNEIKKRIVQISKCKSQYVGGPISVFKLTNFTGQFIEIGVCN